MPRGRAATTTPTASRCGWPAAAFKGGASVGETDELGSAAVENPFHVKHLHATILHQLGLRPEQAGLFLRRTRPEAGRRRTGRADSPDPVGKRSFPDCQSRFEKANRLSICASKFAICIPWPIQNLSNSITGRWPVRVRRVPHRRQPSSRSVPESRPSAASPTRVGPCSNRRVVD